MNSIRTSSKIISLWMAVALALGVFVGMPISVSAEDGQLQNPMPMAATPTQLSAPGNPHWDGDTGTAVWDNVPNSGTQYGPNGVSYHWRLYKKDTATPPAPDEGGNLTSGSTQNPNYTASTYSRTLASYLTAGDGYYYFPVCAVGDGLT